MSPEAVLSGRGYEHIVCIQWLSCWPSKCSSDRFAINIGGGGGVPCRVPTRLQPIMRVLLVIGMQTLTALMLLAEGGSFVCKIFEAWSEPTASLVYLLHQKFRRVAIMKPITRQVLSACIALILRLTKKCGHQRGLNPTISSTHCVAR